MTELRDIYNEWLNNPHFRERFKKDPIQACKEVNFTISPEDLVKIESLLKLNERGSDDGKLDERISK